MVKHPRKSRPITQRPNARNAPAPRVNGVREVGELLPEVGALAFRRFGFSHGVLVSRWREIVGPVYARWSVPESLRPSRDKSAGGTLTVRVESAFAPQLQHVAPQLIARINRILGPNSVARLRLVQGDVLPPGPKRTAPAVSADRLAMSGESNIAPLTAEKLQAVADSGLRAALADLAAQIALGRKPRGIG